MANAASKRSRRPAAPAGRNLLERLLIECVRPTREVPSESGVRFHVHVPTEADNIVCLIFHVDLQPNPLVLAGPRPDYLVLHCTADRMILTIVEMKGRGEQDLTHGVDQIAAFARLLREQLREHLPAKLKFVLQGVLLMAHGAHAPLSKLAEMARHGLVIIPVSYHHSAELFPYVSRVLTLNEIAYIHQTTRPRAFSVLERVLAEGTLPRRKRDAFSQERWRPGKPGIYVNYADASATRGKHRSEAYAALSADPTHATIGVSGGALRGVLEEELESRLGFPSKRRFLRLVDIACDEGLS